MLKRIAKYVLRDVLKTQNNVLLNLRKKIEFLREEKSRVMHKEMVLQGKAVFEDVFDSDQISIWKDMLKWADDKQARIFGFDEINSLLNKMAAIDDKVTEFYRIQGALEQMDRFLRLPQVIETKLEYAIGEANSENEPDDEPSESMSDINI